MKSRVLILLVLAATLFAAKAQSDKDWDNIFNGKDLKGWEKLNGTADFTIEEGVIVGTSKINTPNTFLATKKRYTDFILEYEAKIDSRLNAGVQFRSNQKPETGRVFGYQVELDPSDRAWSGGIFCEASRGWMYSLECNLEAKKAFKQNEFNKFRVEAIEHNIRVWINGVPSADIIDDDTAEGFIALQVHGIGSNPERAGTQVMYKNIRIITDNLDKFKTPASNEIPQHNYLQNTLTEREIKEGWKLLWDGKTTEGWKGAKLDKFPEQGWEIEDGVLSVLKSDGGESTNGGDIITTKKYKNFVLEVDFIYTKAANSGIKYFVDPGLNKGKGSSIGCEYQILDDKNHPDANNGTAGNRTLASLYDLIKADAGFYSGDTKEKRLNGGYWNRAKIVVDGAHVEHYLNNIKVLDYTRRTQEWRALVAYSKYANWPNFGELEEGHILLQDHGDLVKFRNVKIKELK